MKDEKMKIEQRLQNMKNFYLKAGDLIDKLPDAIPEKTKVMIKDAILGDENLKKLMDGIDSHRPPRIFLIGRTGVGKSSLINALCGAYVANVSDIKSCTENAEMYQCKENDRVLMEILDTRGIAESKSLNKMISAEEMLINSICKITFNIGSFFGGFRSYVVERFVELSACIKFREEEEPLVLLDEGGQPFTKDTFIAALADFDIGEWRRRYTTKRFGYTVCDGTQWELVFEYNNGHKPVRFDGDNSYPYNFKRLEMLFGIDVTEKNLLKGVHSYG